MPKMSNIGNVPSISTHTHMYQSFRGVDFSVSEAMVDDTRSPSAQNLISDTGGFPEKRVGWRALQTVSGVAINGMWRFDGENPDGEVVECFIVHAGTSLYKWNGTDAPVLLMSGVADTKSFARYFKGRLCILTGREFIIFDGEKAQSAEDAAYIPTTTVSRVIGDTPGGTFYQDVSLVTTRRKNTFKIAAASGTTWLKFILDGKVAENTRVVMKYIPTGFKLFDAVVSGTNGSFSYSTSGADGDVWKYISGNVGQPYVSTVGGYIAGGLKTSDIPDFVSGAVSDNISVEFSSLSPVRRTKEVFTGSNPTINPVAVSFDLGRLINMPSNIYIRTIEGRLLATVAVNYAGTCTLSKTEDVFVSEVASVSTVSGTTRLNLTQMKTMDNFVAYDKGNNIRLEFESGTAQENIRKCTLCGVFENRVFFSGNPEYPNTDWSSAVNEPTYVPDINYTEVGVDSTAIVGYLRTGDSLAILKEDGEDATIYMRTMTYDADGKAIFPIKQGASGVGAVAPHAVCSFLDDPVFLTKNGVYAVAQQDISAERALNLRSTRVNNKLLAHDGLNDAVMCVWNGYLLLCVGGVAYVADAAQKSYANNKTGTFEYEWYYWTNIPARVMCEHDGALYFGTEDGKLCRMSDDLKNDRGELTSAAYEDDGAAITAIWTTPLSDDGDFMLKKTMVKKGSGVFLKSYNRSGIKVKIRTDADFGTQIVERSAGIFNFDDIDFEEFTFNTAPYSVVPFNTKIKKYKAIQIILCNDKKGHAFGVQGIVRRYTVGNYVK